MGDTLSLRERDAGAETFLFDFRPCLIRMISSWLDTGNHAGAVAETFLFNSSLVQQRQMQVGEMCAVRQRQVLTAQLELAFAAARDECGDRVVTMLGAIAH